MGILHSSHNERDLQEMMDMFQKDNISLERTFFHGKGFGAIGRFPNSHETPPILRERPIDMTEYIEKKQGPHKKMYYVTGDHYTMGFIIGKMCAQEIEEMCTTYLNHLIPQFLSEALDFAMRSAPSFIRKAYERFLNMVTSLVMAEAVPVYEMAVKKKSIPDELHQELLGLVAGAQDSRTVTAVTYERLVTSNYGFDFLLSEGFSGRLVTRLKTSWEKMPKDIQDQVPFKDQYMIIPDMCNAFMVSGKATKSGHGSYLFRDFQLNSAHVFHRLCTIIIRKPKDTGHMSAAVAMPGMIGCVTGLNQYGVASGVNLVRSSAVDKNQDLGIGCMMMIRKMTQEAKSVDDIPKLFEDNYLGCPWLFYAADAQGKQKVFEVIAKSTDHKETLIPEKWVDPKIYRPDKYPTPKDMQHWHSTQHKFGTGVWPRDSLYTTESDDQQLLTWNQKIDELTPTHLLTEKERWKPGNFIHDQWQDEEKQIGKYGNLYFPPWKHIQPGVTVITNSFLNPCTRITQMTALANYVERIATGNQWRFDKITKTLMDSYGNIDLEAGKTLIQFLSPWKEPGYPQNTRIRRKPPSFEEIIQLLQNEKCSLGEEDLHRNQGYEAGVLISGALSVVDCVQRTMENKSGYWGTDFYKVTLPKPE